VRHGFTSDAVDYDAIDTAGLYGILSGQDRRQHRQQKCGATDSSCHRRFSPAEVWR
jgi:hypothetical protein